MSGLLLRAQPTRGNSGALSCITARPKAHVCCATGSLRSRRSIMVVRAQTSSGFERPSDRVGSCAGQHLPPEREARRPHQQQPSSATAAHAFVGTLGGGFTPQLAGVRQPAADAAAATSTTTPPHNRQLQQPSAPTSSAEGQHHHHHGHTVKSAPYHLLAPNWDPLVGRSRQHLRVQKEVLKASTTHSPLVISGDAGLNTLQLAATVHALGLRDEDTSHPIVVVDCSSPSGVIAAHQLLMGGLGDTPLGSCDACSSIDVANDLMLLSALSEGTLVLDNIHKAPHSLLALAATAMAHLLPSKQQKPTTGSNNNINGNAHASGSRSSRTHSTQEEQPGSFLRDHRTRLVLISQLSLTQLAQQLSLEALSPSAGATAALAAFKDCPSIALPALRARPSDVCMLAVAAGQATATLRGYGSIELTDAAQMQLTSYDFPGNEAELHGLVQRAIMLHPPAPAAAHNSSGSFDSPGCSCDGATNRSSTCNGSNGSSFTSSTTSACAADCPESSNSSSSFSSQAQHVLTLDAGDFWAATGDADRARIDVLEVFPWLRRFILDTGFWPVGLNRVTAFLYPLVLASLFMGPQDRESSAALTVFWAGWWPLVMLSFPFVGRAWCSICPFMITGEAAQDFVDVQDAAAGGVAGSNTTNTHHSSASANTAAGAAASGVVSNGFPAAAASAAATTTTSLAQGAFGVAAAGARAANRRAQMLSQSVAGMVPQGWQLQKWPTEAIEPWAGWFVVAAFAAILCWEAVWDLPAHASLSGWLLVLITAGAVGCSVVFEKRLWCRYLCPIGAMNGLFSKLSMSEIRSRSGLCAAAACTKPCQRGRIDHQTVEVPCSSPAGSSSSSSLIPSWLSALVPSWGSSAAGCDSCSSSSCSSNDATAGGCTASSCSTDTASASSGHAISTYSGCSAFMSDGGELQDSHYTAPQNSSSSSSSAPCYLPPPSTAASNSAAQQSEGGATMLVSRDVLLPGCPLNMAPGKHQSNSLCIMCGNCLRSCTSGSAQWRLRPPAADLWGGHEASWAELQLMNVLLGSVLLHRVPEVCAQLGLPAEQIMSEKGPFLALSVALLAAPTAFTWLFHKGSSAAMQHLARKAAAAQHSAASVLTSGVQRAGPNMDVVGQGELSDADAQQQQQQTAGGVSWQRMSYSVLPLVWAGMLAHYEELLLTELGLVAPRLALSLGFPHDSAWLPALPTLGPVQPEVVAAAQGVTLFLGTALSLALAGKIGAVEVQRDTATAAQAAQAVLPQRILTMLIAVELWHIIL